MTGTDQSELVIDEARLRNPRCRLRAARPLGLRLRDGRFRDRPRHDGMLLTLSAKQQENSYVDHGTV